MEKSDERKIMERLRQTMERLANHMESMRIAEYVEIIKNPRRFLWVNFTLGLVRGIGIFIGMAILGAILVSIGIFILRQMVTLPVIGEKVIAPIVDLINEHLSQGVTH